MLLPGDITPSSTTRNSIGMFGFLEESVSSSTILSYPLLIAQKVSECYQLLKF